ncbi:MAG: hypothetical protein HZB09_00315 [Candidatus Yonathbacteria bacterium]|nr:hypothetical protein [Candidatus Yonathbacteria bacterium]
MKQLNKAISMLQRSANKNILFISATLLALIAIPEVSLAFTFERLSAFFITEIVNNVVILIIGLAVLYFLRGVAKYILHSDDAKAREEGRNMMIYGVIALFVMVSMWGLVNLLDKTFGLDKTALPDPGDFLQ